MNISISQALIEHIDDLGQLFDDYRVFYKQPSDLKACKEFLKERILNKESIIFVATDLGDQVVGFTQLYPIYSSTRLKKAWLLNDLFVKPTAREKGVSKLLIERAKTLCINTHAHGIMLETEKTNTIGNKLYPSVGFQISNGTTNYYEWNPS